MAQSTSSRLLDSSYIESFIAILRKLAIKEFASEKIPRHSVIRKQIESLVTSRSDIETLCSALHKCLTQGIDGPCVTITTKENWKAFPSSGTVATVPLV